MMKLLVALGCLIVLASGCASIDNKAMCDQAKNGIVVAQIALVAASPAAMEYYQRYLGAAMAIRDIYCPPVDATK